MESWVAPILNRLKGIKAKNDEILTGVATLNNTQTILNSIVAKESSIQEVLSKLGNGNTESFIINAMLSDDASLNEWAFRQNGIGSAINNAFALNSTALSKCNTVTEIASNSSAINVIGSNIAAVTVCVKNKTLASALSDELILAANMGYYVFNVGDTVTINWSGSSTVFRVVDKNYNRENTINLVSENVLAKMQWYSYKYDGYTSSILRSWLNSTFLSGLSDAMQAAIYPVGGDKVSAPSYTEVGLDTNNKGFAYFTSNTLRKKTFNNTACEWWLCTHSSSSDTSVFYIDTYGNVSSTSSYVEFGVVPTFVI